MSVQNVSSEMREARKGRTLTLTAATPLTAEQARAYDVVIGGNYTVTLPAASADLEGVELRFSANASSLVVAGLGTTAALSLSLAVDQMAIVYCTGTIWSPTHHTAAA